MDEQPTNAASETELMTALAETTAHDSRAVQLLRTIVDDEQGITRQQLADLWGVSPQAIYFMLNHRIHISIERWALLFDELRDERIMRLLVDPRKFAIYALPEVIGAGDKAGIAHAWIKLHELHNGHSLFVDRLLGILEDGRVDGDDGELIADLRHTMPEYIATLLAAARHVDAMYEEWNRRHAVGMNRKAVAR